MRENSAKKVKMLFFIMGFLIKLDITKAQTSLNLLN